jgi:hypothetical protein
LIVKSGVIFDTIPFSEAFGFGYVGIFANTTGSLEESFESVVVSLFDKVAYTDPIIVVFEGIRWEAFNDFFDGIDIYDDGIGKFMGGIKNYMGAFGGFPLSGMVFFVG